jgi:uncharacterized protein (TIGR02996 family)
MRTFVFNDDKSKKFWNIELKGTSYTVTFGKVGTSGQTQVKEFPSADAARNAHDKLVAEKVGKGYVETTTTPQPAPAPVPVPASPLQRSLEEALAENPDDLAAHSAYADYLMEQGDPRGEFIQVQLALEDSTRSANERKQLQAREQDLLKQHGRQWLGDLGRFLFGDWSGEDKPWHYRFARGWLDTVRLLPFPDAIVAVLARSPEARLLRRLEIVYDMRYHPFEFDEVTKGPIAALTPDEPNNETYEPADILRPLLQSPYLTNLRVFKLGFSDNRDHIGHSTMVDPFGTCTIEQIIKLLEKCPHLEALYLNTNLRRINELFALPSLENLRVLQYYFGTSYYDYNNTNAGNPYPLSMLANNASLTELTTLRLHPGRDTTIDLAEMQAVLRSPHLSSLTDLQVHMTTFGNEGCRAIVESGILRRLKRLDIGHGNMTDDGARLLAECPDLKHPKELVVSRNALTTEGIDILKQSGIRVIADDQHELDDEEYLYEVDFE